MSSSLFHSLNISSQTLSNKMAELDTISNNMANMNTTGFRSTRLNFQEVMSSQNLEGAKLANSQVSTNAGDIVPTENSLDWAVVGDGYFPVTLPNGDTGYSRNGEFHLDSNNQIVNSSGYVLDWDGEVPDGTTSISVGTDGTITATLEDGTTSSAGNLQLAVFSNPSGLINVGNNVWIAGDASGKATLKTPGEDGCGKIQGNAYESSNVDLSSEMANLIIVQRGFQLSSKVLQQTDTMINESIHLRKA
jgi:flagellar basal-body rod protein FlgG